MPTVSVSPIVAEVEVIPEEHISERMQIVDVPVPLDQPGDPACLIPADTSHRQNFCYASCDAKTSSVTLTHTVDQPRQDSADTLLRQGYCRRACCDAATGPSDTDGLKDCDSPRARSPF